MARSIRLLPLFLVAMAALAHVQACSSGDSDLSSTVADDAGKPVDRRDAIAGGDDASTSLTTLRLAHLAPQLGAIDFCYQAARAGSFEGPVLRGGGSDTDASADAAVADADASPLDASADASADASTAARLRYASVSKYFTVEATGTITVAIVPAGATSCTNPIAQGNVTLDPGKLSTVALFAASALEQDAGDAGDAGAEAGVPSIFAFTDNRATKPDRARVRMIHAAPAGVLTVHVTGAAATALAERLEPRKASTASQAIPVDALGFATIKPVAPPSSLVVMPFTGDGGSSSTSWESAPSDLELRGDSLHTGFVLGGRDGGFEVLWCADKSTTAELTACTLLR